MIWYEDGSPVPADAPERGGFQLMTLGGVGPVLWTGLHAMSALYYEDRDMFWQLYAKPVKALPVPKRQPRQRTMPSEAPDRERLKAEFLAKMRGDS